MVVLSVGLQIEESTIQLAKKLEIDLDKYNSKIAHSDMVFFIGSCFSQNKANNHSVFSSKRVTRLISIIVL